MTFDNISLKIYRLSEKVNEESIKRVSDLSILENNCIDLMAACAKMVQYCGDNK